MTKTYDKDYFSHWYQKNSKTGQDRAHMQRKLSLAVSGAEYFLGHPVRSVLDIGAGTGLCRAPLLKMRPKLKYIGLDSSEYAVRRFGRTRNLMLARVGDLDQFRPCPPVDLLICADVLHYVDARELKRALPGLAELCAGVAYLETYCKEDQIQGDTEGFFARPARFYRDAFESVGFRQIGAQLWLSPNYGQELARLEMPA